MEQLRTIELKLVDDLFGMSSGYVLDFTNATFAELFSTDVGVDIYDEVYASGGGSKGKRLRTFLKIAQPLAIVRALTALWEYRETRRVGAGDPEPIADGRVRLTAIVERLGGASLQSYDTRARSANSASARMPERPAGPDLAALDRLEQDFMALYAMSDEPQARGYHFEKLLTALFNAWHMDAREGFRVVGEQIDGSFQHDGATYLLEAKWQRSKADAATLHGFQGKVGERLIWTRGLFVSFEGFTDVGLQAFTAKQIVLADGMDIYDALKRRISMPAIITAKNRYASEYRNPFQRVRDLFPV